MKNQNYKMPAEWQEHIATWMSWPLKKSWSIWYETEEEKTLYMEKIYIEYSQLVLTIAKFEPVHLIFNDEQDLEIAKKYLGDFQNIKTHIALLDDSWIRDNGPIFVKNEHNENILIDWEFNAWGGKFDWRNDNKIPKYIADFLNIKRIKRQEILEGGGIEVNGKGIGITTESCFLTSSRNNFTKKDYEFLKEVMGINKLIWLKGGLENDHTDGHIDTITRFVDEKTIVTSVCKNKDDANYQILENNLKILLEESIKEDFKIIKLPLPEIHDVNGLTAATYANFYLGNGFCVVPQYGHEYDQEAIEILKSVFKDRKVIGLSSRNIIINGGSFHCLTQQQPK